MPFVPSSILYLWEAMRSEMDRLDWTWLSCVPLRFLLAPPYANFLGKMDTPRFNVKFEAIECDTARWENLRGDFPSMFGHLKNISNHINISGR